MSWNSTRYASMSRSRDLHPCGRARLASAPGAKNVGAAMADEDPGYRPFDGLAKVTRSVGCGGCAPTATRPTRENWQCTKHNANARSQMQCSNARSARMATARSVPCSDRHEDRMNAS